MIVLPLKSVKIVYVFFRFFHDCVATEIRESVPRSSVEVGVLFSTWPTFTCTPPSWILNSTFDWLVFVNEIGKSVWPSYMRSSLLISQERSRGRNTFHWLVREHMSQYYYCEYMLPKLGKSPENEVESDLLLCDFNIFKLYWFSIMPLTQFKISRRQCSSNYILFARSFVQLPWLLRLGEQKIKVFFF